MDLAESQAEMARLHAAVRHRARFEALRRDMFDEMGQAAARWRLAWFVPFQLFIIGVLVARGEPTWRAVVQGAALVLSTANFVARVRWKPRSDRGALTSMTFGALLSF